MRHGLGFHNRHSAFGFQPISLYTGGVAGAWYDPSDYGASGTGGVGTLFQDSAGTTPVTAVEQVVGLMLDKSQGLVLGAELFTSTASGGAFGNAGATTYTNNIITTVGAPNNGRSSNRFIVTGGKSYKVVFAQQCVPSGGTWDIAVSWSADGTTLGGFAIASAPISTTSLIFTVPATAIRAEVSIIRQGASSPGATDTCTFAGMSIRELPGAHATATGTARPTLSARVNLLTKTSTFEVGSGNWFSANIFVTAGVADPNGGTNAVTLRSTTTGTGNQLYAAKSVAVGTSVLWSVYLRRRFGTGIVRLKDPNGTGSTDITSQLTSSWKLFTITSVPFSDGNAYPGVFINTQNDEIDAAFPDLRVANDGVNIPPYQRVNTATDYDTAGFPLYLSFAGAQAMSTPANIDFSGTDKMLVCAGVRKLSELSYPTLVELSVAIGSNNGSFAIYTSGSSTPRYPVYLQGTTQTAYEPQTYAAPISNVLGITLDISGATRAEEIFPRINGVLNQTNPAGSTGAAGIGNFGSYPLFIGARNLGSFFFNGRLYGLIVAGSQYTAGQVSATESYMNTKTRAYA